jgi:hypothetical protein
VLNLQLQSIFYRKYFGCLNILGCYILVIETSTIF